MYSYRLLKRETVFPTHAPNHLIKGYYERYINSNYGTGQLHWFE